MWRPPDLCGPGRIPTAGASLGFGIPVTFRLFGNPAAFDGERWHELGHTLDDAVLCYLALAGGWLARAVLAGRFWPDSDEAAARANLRWRLHRLRSRPYAAALETTRDHVRWAVETDVARFWRAHEAGAWDDAVDLVQAPLLGDTRFACSPVVEAEFTREREQVHRAWREVALERAAAAQAERHHADAAALLRRVLTHDLLDEEVLQAFLHAAYVDGQREQALRVFGAFEEQLREELGIVPLAQTRALVSTIKQADALLGSALTPGEPTDVARPVGGRDDVPQCSGALPRFPTPFLGRVEEHDRLLRLLCNGSERIVTLLGPGGVGKTRLAVEVARELAPQYRDGAVFVDLAALADAGRLAATVVEAVAPDERVGHDAEAQLSGLLRERALMLLLDTFEHVMDGKGVVQRIAATAPEVRLLVTSRVRLGLPGERTFDVDGLACPEEDAPSDEVRAHPGVALFETIAARSLDGFAATERDRRAIVRVCRLVAGLPLAIELAATWVRTLDCEAIADELAASAEILTAADGHAREHRHTSFEQVFDTSWSLLRPADQAVFAGLAVFRGGFTRETANQVTGASLRHLRTLIDASLVQRFGSRYVLLDVIQRLAEQRLDASGSGHEVRSRHAGVFSRLVQAHEADFDGPVQGRALALLNPESDNLRAAWDHAVERRDVSVLARMSRGVSSVWDLRGRFVEAADMFAAAATALERAEASDEAALGWAWMRMREGWFRFYLGQYDALEGVLVEAGERFEHFGETAAAGTTAFILGSAANARGDLAAGRDHLRVATDCYERAGDRAGLAKCQNALGMAEEAVGAFGSAREHYQRSLRERERLGDPRGLIVVLNNLGAVSVEFRLLDEAEGHLQRALRLSRSSDDAWGLAWTTHNLGEVALAQDRRDAARAAFERALKGLITLGHHYAASLTLERLGEVLLPHAPEEAAVHFRHGLRIALDIGATPRVAQLTAWLAWLRAHVDPETGANALACAHHAAGELHRPRSLSERLLAALRHRTDDQLVEAAIRRGPELDLHAEAEALCRWVEVAELPHRLDAAPSVDASGV